MTTGPTFEVLTLFPDAVGQFVGAGLLGKAIERGLVQVFTTDIRDHTDDRHRTVDDTPFGGGAGMVMKIEPVVRALEAVEQARGPSHRVLLTPTGDRFDQKIAEALAQEPRITLVCGRYEGIDDRVRQHFVHRSLSIGDFVLNGGELAALVVIESVARLCEGVLGNPESLATESFRYDDEGTRWLEHPQFTRPSEFRGLSVPDVLLSGDHAAIARWRRGQARARTWTLRPDLAQSPAQSLAQSPTLSARAPTYVALADPGDPAGVEELSAVIRHHGLAGLILLGPGSDEQVETWAAHGGGKIALAAARDYGVMRRRLNRAHGGLPRGLWVFVPETEGDAVKAQGFAGDEDPREAGADPALVLFFCRGDGVGVRIPPPGDVVQVAPDRPDSQCRSVLALPNAMVDSSQPWPARVAIVVDRIMGALRLPSTHA